MGRHKLDYKMKKPNAHHKYWRYVLSTDPKQSEISTKTTVRYEAELVAKEAFQAAIDKKNSTPTFEEYAKDFFSDYCKLCQRKASTSKPMTFEMMRLKRGHLLNFLIPQFGKTPIDGITAVMFEDWRVTIKRANTTRNGITVTMKQILDEAVRDNVISSNPMIQVEPLAKILNKPRDSVSVDEMKKLFPLDYSEALKVWRTEKYHTLMFVLISSGMRSGEVRALQWEDVIWKDSGILITKAIKNTNKVGTVKEKKRKFVRVPSRTMELLGKWREVSEAKQESDFIFYGKTTDRPVDRATIISNFRKGLSNAGIKTDKNLVPHSLRHTFNSYMLAALPSDVVRRFTGHSSEQMSEHYYHPLLRQELKATEKFQGDIDAVWNGDCTA